MISQTRAVVAASVVLFLVCSTQILAEDEQHIPLDQVPAVVQEAVKKAAGGAVVSQVGKEMEDGKLVFEAKLKVNGAEHTLAFSEDGKLLEDEEEIKVADLPAAVAAAIAKALPNGTITEASKVNADGKSFYEADLKVGAEEHEIKVAEDGTVIANKVEKEEKEEKDSKK